MLVAVELERVLVLVAMVEAAQVAEVVVDQAVMEILVQQIKAAAAVEVFLVVLAAAVQVL
jgi:hypothetical protein